MAPAQTKEQLLTTRRIEGGEAPRPRSLPLGTRMFGGAAALLLVTLGGALGFASWQMNRLASERVTAALEAAPDIYSGFSESLAASRKAAVRARAEDVGTRALLAEGPAISDATWHDSGLEYAKLMGAERVFFFDDSVRLIARSDRAAGEERGRDFSGAAWAGKPAKDLVDASGFIFDAEPKPRLSLAAGAPVTQGQGTEAKLNGVLAATWPLDDQDAARLSRLAAADVAFVADLATPGAAPKLVTLASTPHLADSRFAASLAGAQALLAPVFAGKDSKPFPLSIGSEEYLALALPIRSGRGEAIAIAIVLKSKTEELAPFRKTRDGLLAIGALLLLVSLPVSLALARRISKPVEQLALVAEELRSGRLDMVVPEDTGDEVGTLARAFRKLVSDLKEKAALEALIAEMQRRPGDETHERFAASPTTTSALPDSGRTAAANTVSPLGSEASPGPKPGAVFATRYEILSLLGEGGMGRVYRANDRQLDEEVALKVLGSPADNLTGTGAPSIAAPEAVASLKEEIRIARRITHPNVVRTHDFGEAAGLNFITMEYVPGTTLRELLRARKTIDLAPGLQIAKQICRGLMAVHEAGIVHRDLKPHNVMVMGNGVVKLMDFGIAKRQDGRKEKTTTTEGTPFYMSPEQFRGEPPDPRSDLYSAGLLFWEIFAGRHCFTATDIEDLIQKQLHSVPPWLKTVRPDVPDLLSRTIAACVEKDPEKRPRSARDLERVLSNVNLL